ncbi:lipopolysaccharide biosynthesis protein [Streptomyces sp. NBC_00820]|uniref:lipopolysaccharide biosynthesis protein n=1 Tax=Streptomyces sp. NBC_00820 TaxID=2975842 RepID=UPI002ED44698|nr:lipopolysaccharide biosynthesis protein [Streptomyces sp. NBC_00820]
MTETHSRRHRTASRPPGGRTLPPWSLVAAGVLAGGLLGGAYGVLKPPVYTATSYLVAVPTEHSDTASALGFAQVYGRVATQDVVLAEARAGAGVPLDTLRDSVRTATSPDAPMVAVSATSARPAQAAAMANAVAVSLAQHADATKADTHVGLQRFAPAVPPSTPTSASAGVTALVGASAGGLLGGLALLVRPGRRPEEEPARPASLPGPTLAADAHRPL